MPLTSPPVYENKDDVEKPYSIVSLNIRTLTCDLVWLQEWIPKRHVFFEKKLCSGGAPFIKT
jgi:hypothetical protein